MQHGYLIIVMTPQEEYDEAVAEFQALTIERNNTKPGEDHNKLTRKRNEIRKRITAARTKLPNQIMPNESLAQDVVDERIEKVIEHG